MGSIQNLTLDVKPFPAPPRRVKRKKYKQQFSLSKLYTSFCASKESAQEAYGRFDLQAGQCEMR